MRAGKQAVDPALRAIEAEATHHELLTEAGPVHDPHPRCEGADGFGKWMRTLGGLVGKTPAELRIPGSRARRSGEGPQLKLRLCKWLDKMNEAGGGGEDVWEACLGSAAEEWDKDKWQVKKIYEEKDKWKKQCEVRGVCATGLLMGEATLPEWMRKNRSGGGEVKRAQGGATRTLSCSCTPW